MLSKGTKTFVRGCTSPDFCVDPCDNPVTVVLDDPVTVETGGGCVAMAMSGCAGCVGMETEGAELA